VKIWRVIVTDADGCGEGRTFQDRWQAEEEYERQRKPGRLVTLAEFINNRQTEIVRDTRWESKEKP